MIESSPQSYLLRHLKVDKAASAARHDPDRSRFRLVASREAGNGKSLLCRRIKGKERTSSTLQIQEISYTEIVSHWLETPHVSAKTPHVYHLDISMGVESGRNDLLFSLAVLGGLVDSKGKVWLCSDSDLYLVEVTLPELRNLEEGPRQGNRKKQSFCLALPLILCEPPRETHEVMKRHNINANRQGDIFIAENGRLTQGFDSAIYNSAKVQRPCGFLTLYRARDTRNLDLYEFRLGNGYGEDRKPQVLETLLHYCPVEAPTWAELSHFASFLNVQLETTERSVFCNSAVVGEELRGFKNVVVDFNLTMAQDFSSRSIEISGKWSTLHSRLN